MSKRFAVVMTTINMPVVLDSYARNCRLFGHEADVFMIVIPDRKTPEECGEATRRFAREGFDVDYVDLDRQDAWLDRFPDLKPLIPYNSDNRRNIGFLMALERGCDVLVSIDDDNFATDEEDYFGEHGSVGSIREMPVVGSDTGWFNICTMMDNTHDVTIYPRGYPYSLRTREERYTEEVRAGFVAANAGLWSNDPDIDALTRLNDDVKTLRQNRSSVLLDVGVRSPVNTQNTAVLADAVVAYYYVLMGEPVHGSRLDRYGDIWSGYFLGKCIEHMQHHIAVGAPVAYHERNKHDLFLDLRQELWGMILTEALTEVLADMTLRGTTYAEAYRCLADELEDAIHAREDPNFDGDVKAYFRKITHAMRTWVDVCEELRPSASPTG